MATTVTERFTGAVTSTEQERHTDTVVSTEQARFSGAASSSEQERFTNPSVTGDPQIWTFRADSFAAIAFKLPLLLDAQTITIGTTPTERFSGAVSSTAVERI